MRNSVQEEINKKINILMDFKKKIKMIFQLYMINVINMKINLTRLI